MAGKLKINAQLCSACGLCKSVCIRDNIEIDGAAFELENNCFECGHCMAICPEGAISIIKYDNQKDRIDEYDSRQIPVDYEDLLQLLKQRRSIRWFKNKKIDIDSEVPLENLGFGNLVDQLYKKVARPHLVNPVFLTEHPISLSPLARANDENKQLTDRFQLIINGAEIINAYSELVDPIIQRETLMAQLEEKANGDEETMDLDEAFLKSMEHGMPPMSGLGFGIDRFVMLIYDLPNIRDSVMFPIMR